MFENKKRTDKSRFSQNAGDLATGDGSNYSQIGMSMLEMEYATSQIDEIVKDYMTFENDFRTTYRLLENGFSLFERKKES